jgi:hypothetical protein
MVARVAVGTMALLMLSACASRGATTLSNQMNSDELTLQGSTEGNEDVYCLLRKHVAQSRKIYGRPTSDFQSDDKFDYKIRGGLGHDAPSGIKIESGDRFTIWRASEHGDLLLVHSDASRKEKARAVLNPEGSADSTRWMFGRAENGNGESIGGDYFVYFMGVATPCLRKEGVQQKSCKVLHFEYFDRKDSASILNEKPFNCGIVVSNDVSQCRRYASESEVPGRKMGDSDVDGKDESKILSKEETSEGDGDHGPNH